MRTPVPSYQPPARGRDDPRELPTYDDAEVTSASRSGGGRDRERREYRDGRDRERERDRRDYRDGRDRDRDRERREPKSKSSSGGRGRDEGRREDRRRDSYGDSRGRRY